MLNEMLCGPSLNSSWFFLEFINMKGYKCCVCDYIYYTEKGEAGTKESFDKLPADWRCPRCGSHKSCFVCFDDDRKNTKNK